MSSAIDQLEKDVDEYNKELFEQTSSGALKSSYDKAADLKRRHTLKDEIENVQEKEAASINARQKRKFKRFLEFVEQSVEDVVQKIEASNTAIAIAAEEKAIASKGKGAGSGDANSVPKKRLDHAKIADVSVFLDSIVIPDRNKLSSDEEYLTKKAEILKVLEEFNASPDTNKIIRRRISRITYVLNNPPPEVAPSTATTATSTTGTSSTKKNNTTAPASSNSNIKGNNASSASGGGAIEQQVEALLKSATADEVETNITTISAEIIKITNPKLLKAIIAKLDEWTAGGLGGTNLPSKLKRRVGRLSEQLGSNLSNFGDSNNTDEMDTTNSNSNSNSYNDDDDYKRSSNSYNGLGNSRIQVDPTLKPLSSAKIMPPSSITTTSAGKTIDIHAILKKIRFSKEAQDVEKCLIFIKLNIKELITNKELGKLLTKKKEDFDVMLEGKAKERYSQILHLFEKGPDSAAVVSNPSSSNSNSNSNSNSMEEDTAVKPTIEKHVPCIVFVGQLSFNLSSAELEKFLRDNGIEGKISVRLLNEPQTGFSRGMAFVELEGPREMQKTLSLHHSVLGGRKINIEQSAGGRNKEVRQNKIKEKRQEQVKSTFETIDQILAEYQAQGLISVDALDEGVKRTFYYNPPTFLREVMEKFSKKPEDSRTLGDLSSIAYIHRNLKYGAAGGSANASGGSSEQPDDNEGPVVSDISIKLIKRARENNERAARAMKKQKDDQY